MPSRRKDRGNRWQGSVVFENKPYRKLFDTRREAAEWEVQFRKELEEEKKETERTKTRLTLKEFVGKYLKDVQIRFTRKTFDKRRMACGRLQNKLDGSFPVEQITADMIREHLLEGARKKGASASNEDRKGLLAMWSWGQVYLDLPTNPVAKVPALPHDVGPQYTPPTQDILKVLAATTQEESVFLQAYLNTGARRSEIFRWTWGEDINFDKRRVRLGTRKTKDGSMKYEWMPMNETLYQALQWLFNNRKFKDTPYVFVSDSNRHYGQPFTTRRQFMKGLCKRAGVKPFGFHALRRYVASYLAGTQNTSSKTIQRILRHGSLSTTERYIKAINRDLEATMELLGDKSQTVNRGSKPGEANEV